MSEEPGTDDSADKRMIAACVGVIIQCMQREQSDPALRAEWARRIGRVLVDNCDAKADAASVTTASKADRTPRYEPTGTPGGGRMGLRLDQEGGLIVAAAAKAR